MSQSSTGRTLERPLVYYDSMSNKWTAVCFNGKRMVFESVGRAYHISELVEGDRVQLVYGAQCDFSDSGPLYYALAEGLERGEYYVVMSKEGFCETSGYPIKRERTGEIVSVKPESPIVFLVVNNNGSVVNDFQLHRRSVVP